MQGVVVAAAETRSGILDTGYWTGLGIPWLLDRFLPDNARSLFWYCDAMQILKGAEHSGSHCIGLSVGL